MRRPLRRADETGPKRLKISVFGLWLAASEGLPGHDTVHARTPHEVGESALFVGKQRSGLSELNNLHGPQKLGLGTRILAKTRKGVPELGLGFFGVWIRTL